MKASLRVSVERFLQDAGKLKPATLGPAEISSQLNRNIVTLFEESLREAQRSQARITQTCVVLLCSMLVLQVGFLASDVFSNTSNAGLAIGIWLLSIATIGKLQEIRRDSLLSGLLLRVIVDAPIEEVVRLTSMIYWNIIVTPKPTPIRILLLTSDPESELRLDKEVKEIRRGLRATRMRDQFELHHRSAIQPDELVPALLEIEPTIVHFSGHCDVSGKLRLETSAGAMHAVPPKAFATVFQNFPFVRCVLLNTCYSELHAKAVTEHVEYAIGTKGAIGDEVAIAFAIGFYQALGSGRSLEEAYNIGRAASGLQDTPDHGSLVLMRRSSFVAEAFSGSQD